MQNLDFTYVYTYKWQGVSVEGGYGREEEIQRVGIEDLEKVLGGVKKDKYHNFIFRNVCIYKPMKTEGERHGGAMDVQE